MILALSAPVRYIYSQGVTPHKLFLCSQHMASTAQVDILRECLSWYKGKGKGMSSTTGLSSTPSGVPLASEGLLLVSNMNLYHS